jgi:hypothetical protein
LQDIERATVRRVRFPITDVCRRFTGVKARESALWPKRMSHSAVGTTRASANGRATQERRAGNLAAEPSPVVEEVLRFEDLPVTPSADRFARR